MTRTVAPNAAAGSAPAERRGGRAKGQINRISNALIERVEREYPGYDPIMALVAMSRDESLDASLRISATVAAAPYLRPKLRPIEIVPDIDEMVPTGSLADWSEGELLRVAVRARITGDNSAAVAAHRLLADMHGSLKGERGKMLENDDMDNLTPEQQEDAILEAAREIEAKRKGKT